MAIKTRFGVVSDRKAVKSYMAHLRLNRKFINNPELSRTKGNYHAACMEDIGRNNRVLTKDEKAANAAMFHLPTKGGR